MRFIAIAGGQLLRDVKMDLYREGGGLVAHGTQLETGTAFPYPEPGRYMVVTTWRRPASAHPGAWLVDTSSLTFDVR